MTDWNTTSPTEPALSEKLEPCTIWCRVPFSCQRDIFLLTNPEGSAILKKSMHGKKVKTE